MPIVPYYLGRPSHVWIAALSRRNSAWRSPEDGGLACSDVSAQPMADLVGVPAGNPVAGIQHPMLAEQRKE